MKNGTNKRLFDRIVVAGNISIAGTIYQIKDLSVGGMAVEGPILKHEPDDIMRVEFLIRHGELWVR